MASGAVIDFVEMHDPLARGHDNPPEGKIKRLRRSGQEPSTSETWRFASLPPLIRTANSSPPSRAATSIDRMVSRMRCDNAISIWSPTRMAVRVVYALESVDVQQEQKGATLELGEVTNCVRDLLEQSRSAHQSR